MKTFWFLRLRFRRAYDSAFDSDFRFSLGFKLSYDSDSDSVISENQPFNVKVTNFNLPVTHSTLTLPSRLATKVGFHQRRSRSRSRNQKRRAVRFSENQTDGVGSKTLTPLMIPSFTIKWKLHCRSRKQKRKNKPMTMFYSGLAIGWFFRFRFRLWQPNFHWIISDGFVNGIGMETFWLTPLTTPDFNFH